MRITRKATREWARWFAWYSVTLPDGTWVWLEYVERKLVWIDNPDAMRGDGSPFGWWEWEYRVP